MGDHPGRAGGLSTERSPLMNPFSPSRVTTEEAPKLVARRQQPISLTTLTTTAQTLYTASELYDFMIRHLWAANITGGAVTITLYLVADGGSAADSNAICKGYSIAANTTARLDFIAGTEFGSLMQPGMMLQALASANSSINMGGWGQEVVGNYI
jgi:hypothetical protein